MIVFMHHWLLGFLNSFGGSSHEVKDDLNSDSLCRIASDPRVPRGPNWYIPSFDMGAWFSNFNHSYELAGSEIHQEAAPQPRANRKEIRKRLSGNGK